MIDLKGKETKVGELSVNFELLKDTANEIFQWMEQLPEHSLFQKIELSELQKYMHVFGVFCSRSENMEFTREDLEQFFITKTRINIGSHIVTFFASLAGWKLINSIGNPALGIWEMTESTRMSDDELRRYARLLGFSNMR